ncbi:spore coat protein [Mesobacillus harenae]|uniref:spore coat protein n=1 Tax=Mesobacillus harenae TaxID=2213203 RepID=UPI001580799B|nr:spore coat protein [Mesobacillus harenae]
MGESKVWAGDRPTVKCNSTAGAADRKWSALDPASFHPLSEQDTEELEATVKTIQESFEQIIIKDSADVEVTTTDTQAAVNLQVALQAAITLIISISVADSSEAERLTTDLMGNLKTHQVNRQQTYIENSRGVRVTTTDTDLAVNLQLLLQVLVSLVARLDIL